MFEENLKEVSPTQVSPTQVSPTQVTLSKTACMAETKLIELYKEVVDSVDIVATIGKYTQLTKIGSYYEGKCPFNASCGNSLCVSHSKGMWFCFGCYSKGDVISFVAKIGSMNKSTAARFLMNLQRSSEWATSSVATSSVENPHVVKED